MLFRFFYFSFLILNFSFAAWAAAPSIVEDSVSMAALNGRKDAFVISYTLQGEPAVVTVDIEREESGTWKSMSEQLGVLAGDANTVVYSVGVPAKAFWYPSETLKDVLAQGNYRAVVKAFPTNSPPDYLVIDLMQPKVSAVHFYASTNTFPGGFANDKYKTTCLVMRKIPAKGVVWLAGSPKKLTDEDNSVSNCPAYKVRFTSDYYMAIYEMTQAQHENTGVAHFSKYAGAMRPVERMGMTMIRGTYTGKVYNWPTHTEVDSTKVVGKLRKQCGIADIDLPTQAQWEYAARAGSGTDLPDNLAWSTANVELFAVTRSNRSKWNVNGTGTAIVGSRRPNAWGLYDMLGNVQERVLNRMSVNSGSNLFLDDFQATLAADWATGGVTEDPIGPAASVTDRTMTCGGSHIEWSGDAFFHLGHYDGSSSTWTEVTKESEINGQEGYIGYRLCCSVAAAVGSEK